MIERGGLKDCLARPIGRSDYWGAVKGRAMKIRHSNLDSIRPFVEAAPPSVRVDAHMARDFISLPSWFPAEKAAAVLRQQGRRFALVVNRAGATGLADVGQLAAAAPTKSVLWCARPLGRAVTSDALLDEALTLMTAAAVDHVPVTVDGLLVGILTREAALAGRSPASRDEATDLGGALHLREAADLGLRAA